MDLQRPVHMEWIDFTFQLLFSCHSCSYGRSVYCFSNSDTCWNSLQEELEGSAHKKWVKAVGEISAEDAATLEPPQDACGEHNMTLLTLMCFLWCCILWCGSCHTGSWWSWIPYKLVIPLHFISWKKTPNNAVTPQHQSKFAPKMKANAVPRLLSSLVWID